MRVYPESPLKCAARLVCRWKALFLTIFDTVLPLVMLAWQMVRIWKKNVRLNRKHSANDTSHGERHCTKQLAAW